MKPVKGFNEAKLGEALERHRKILGQLPSLEPKPGELAEVSWEEEFED